MLCGHCIAHVAIALHIIVAVTLILLGATEGDDDVQNSGNDDLHLYLLQAPPPLPPPQNLPLTVSCICHIAGGSAR